MNIMKRLLVIFHIYYHDHIDYYIQKLKNINGVEWDMIVTYNEMKDETMAKVKDLKPDTVFFAVDNTGYDILPFIQAIKAYDIMKYEYIMKLHTKNTDCRKYKLNGISLKNDRWRNILVDSMLKTPERFRRCMNILNDEKTGCLCSYELYVKLTMKRKEDLSLLKNEAERIGIRTDSGKFCAGTMFIIRPECLRKIVEADIDLSRWQNKGSHAKGTIAHVYERLLTLSVEDAGYNISTLPTYCRNYPTVMVHNAVSPVIKWIFSLDRYGEDYRKCLTLFGKRIMLD